MKINNVMYALAYKYQEDCWFDFEKSDITDDLGFKCLLPTRVVAESMVRELSGSEFVIVEVEVISWSATTGVLYLIYDLINVWLEGCEEEDCEDGY